MAIQAKLGSPGIPVQISENSEGTLGHALRIAQRPIWALGDLRSSLSFSAQISMRKETLSPKVVGR